MIDGLCHSDLKLGTAKKALEKLFSEAKNAKIAKVLLCNLPGRQFDGGDGFANEDILGEASQYDGFFRVFAGIDPSRPDALERLHFYKKNGASGIKLHPRLHNYCIEKDFCVDIVRKSGELGLPVIICGFLDGINLMLGNSPAAFGRLAKLCPGTKILMAHAGGHHIIDSVMVMKRCENLYLDISFSILYYRGSRRVMDDIKYSLESSGARRISWGTDYPDRPYAETVRSSLEEIEKMNLVETAKKRLFDESAEEFCA